MIRLALPMVFGMAAIILFNVIDTLYVGRLGSTELAAMSFTFPVVFMLTHLTVGLGVGVTSVIARVIGGGDPDRVRRLTTDGLILANTVVIVLALAGLFSVDPVFRALGAGEERMGTPTVKVQSPVPSACTQCSAPSSDPTQRTSSSPKYAGELITDPPVGYSQSSEPSGRIARRLSPAPMKTLPSGPIAGEERTTCPVG